MNVTQFHRSRCIVFGIAVFFATIICYKLLFGSNKEPLSQHEHNTHNFNNYLVKETKNLEMEDLSPHWKFRPEFSSAPDAPIRIPRRLHQVWDTDRIPTRFEKWMRTWKVVNPDWEYWFWTLDAVRSLIVRDFREFLVLYDSYTAPIFRADFMRYFVLYTYGGVYMDLDMDALKPLDNWTTTYNCIVSEENYEHVFVIHELEQPNIVNGILACRANHPLFKLAIDSLQNAAQRYFDDPLKATGPLFFNSVFQNFLLNSTEVKDVTVVPPMYFLPTYDDSESDTISGKCSPARMRSLPGKGQMLCRQLGAKSFRNDISSLAYTNHHWIHAYMFDETWKKTNTLNVRTIIPSAKLGSEIVANTV